MIKFLIPQSLFNNSFHFWNKVILLMNFVLQNLNLVWTIICPNECCLIKTILRNIFIRTWNFFNFWGLGFNIFKSLRFTLGPNFDLLRFWLRLCLLFDLYGFWSSLGRFFRKLTFCKNLRFWACYGFMDFNQLFQLGNLWQVFTFLGFRHDFFCIELFLNF